MERHTSLQSQTGIAKVYAIIIVVLLLTGVVAGLIIFANRTNEAPAIEDITSALQTDARTNGLVPSNIVLTKQVGLFARGTVVDERDGQTKTFYALKIGEVWRIVDVVTGPVSCERFTRIGFPADFIADCQLSFADAVTVAEIDATIDATFLAAAPLKVIGIVEDVSDEEGTITVSSGGEITTLPIQAGTDTTTVSPGDTVVVTVEPIEAPNTIAAPNTSAPNAGVTNVTTIGSEDDELIDPTTPQNDLPQEAPDDDTDDGDEEPLSGGAEKVQKIAAPNTAPPNSYFTTANDDDTSFEEIQIEGSF